MSKTCIAYNGVNDPEFLLSKIDGTHGIFQSDFINPIPLTEDILLKCGFFDPVPDVKYPEIINYTIEHNDLTYIINFRITEPKFSFWINDLPVVYFNHLHELQNLYFTLTQTELEVQL